MCPDPDVALESALVLVLTESVLEVVMVSSGDCDVEALLLREALTLPLVVRLSDGDVVDEVEGVPVELTRAELLLESDAPDLPLPVPFGAVCRCSPQGRRISEPAHVKILYREVSRLREEPLADMAERIWHNSSALLRPVLGLP